MGNLVASLTKRLQECLLRVLISLLLVSGLGVDSGWNILVRMTERASGATNTTENRAEIHESNSDCITGEEDD